MRVANSKSLVRWAFDNPLGRSSNLGSSWLLLPPGPTPPRVSPIAPSLLSQSLHLLSVPSAFSPCSKPRSQLPWGCSSRNRHLPLSPCSWSCVGWSAATVYPRERSTKRGCGCRADASMPSVSHGALPTEQRSSADRGVLPLPQSVWARQFGETGLFPASKLTDSFLKPRMST